jgi:hypothetical protein
VLYLVGLGLIALIAFLQRGPQEFQPTSAEKAETESS